MSFRARCGLLLGVLLLTIGLAPTARADTRADDIRVTVTVAADGTLAVTEELTFSAAPGEVTRDLPESIGLDDDASFYVPRFGDVAVAGAQPTTAQARRAGFTLDAPGTVTLTYTVDGATRAERGQDGPLTMVQWPAVSGWSVGFDKVEVKVVGPATPQLMDCVAGPVDSVGQCAAYSGGTYDTPDPVFKDGPRAAGEQVVVSVAYAADAVASTATIEHPWSLDRAFTLSLPTLGWALLGALLGAGLLYALHRRTGRDLGASGAVTPVATFVPVGEGESVFRVAEGVRPGHVGTVADERVDPIDITATLLDLAVRGHLLITEQPRTAHGLLDWELSRRSGGGDLAPFEHELLDVVAPEGEPRLVSQLPTALASGIGRVQDALYEDVVARGWFESRPDSTRSSWRVRGYLGLALAAVAAGLLIAFTTLGLLALVLLAVGFGLVWISDQMPRRTASGSAMLGGLTALSSLLATQPTDQMPRGSELPEISKLLGYTVVLGGKERWLGALVAADADDTAPDPTTLDWYHAPDTWHLQDLPASLTQFVHTVQGVLFGR